MDRLFNGFVSPSGANKNDDDQNSAGVWTEMMTRVHYVPKDDKTFPFIMRIHLFPEDCSENVPHNHQSNACSMILAGSYFHKTFQVAQDSVGAKIRFLSCRKFKDNSLGPLKKEPGYLKTLTRNEHCYPNVYFLAQDCYHVVAPCPTSPSQVVSIFVKDKTSGETKFLVDEDDDRPLPCDAKTVLLVGDEKEQVLKKIEGLILAQHQVVKS